MQAVVRRVDMFCIGKFSLSSAWSRFSKDINMICKSFRLSTLAYALASAITLLMTTHINSEPPLNWSAAAGQSEAIKALPSQKQPVLAQSQLGAIGLNSRANELNPQPLPPAQPNPGNSLKSGLGNRVKPLAPLVNDKVNAQTSATKIPNNLFDVEDRAIIIVGGKQSTAGEVKKSLNAEIAKKAGPPKTIKGGARALDLVALNVTKSAINSPAPPRTMERPTPPGKQRPPISQTTSTSTSAQAAISSGSALGVPASRGAEVFNSVSALRCLDKGPPLIDEVEKKLKPGTRVMIWGRCLGDRPGRVEIIGQFPGGKLAPAFTSWEMTGIEIEIPANVRGAADHAVAISVVTAEGKTTPAKLAQFVAARERIDVPERLWSPTAKFELSATGGAAATNAAYSGQLSRTLRVNPQCALYDMDAVVLSGAITQIRGWDAPGPLNEASVSIDWAGTCTETKTISGNDYVVFQGAISVSFDSACRVAFQTQASAYCPVGIAP
jgi:hypothetical protein